MGWSTSTFVFELINFVVLVFLLRRLVYRPLQRGIRERREGALQKERKAEEQLQAAQALQAECRRRSGELDALRATTLREAAQEADEQRARLLQQAREDAGAERVRAERLLETQREEARAWVRDVAVEHSTLVAGQLLLELAPQAIGSALLERLLVEVSGHAEELRRMAVGDPELEVEVTAAQPLTEEQQQLLRRRLEQVLGAPPRLVLRDDPALRAGAVLRAGSVVFDASLAGELDILRERVRSLSLSEARVG